MQKIFTVTLEFLRRGPAHNQLLSPLTEYLVLCGNHPANTVRMPFEHKQLLVRLNALSYEDSQVTREIQLKDTAAEMARILEAAPGLASQMAGAPEPDSQLTHLRIILSSSELAMLPFELSNAPAGCPGEGQTLALQTQQPVCITREVRRVTRDRFQWPAQPRILFIAAAPPSVGSIPFREHLLALRAVIDPWMKYFDPEKAEERRATVAQHLVVLPHADVDQIRRICSENTFSYVHVLAHGVPYDEAGEGRYGLALHHPADPGAVDIVDGERLACLLRTSDWKGNRQAPAVVTLASCESGAVGSVVGAGSSIAHALHQADIPLVVASQFPLSFAASVVMTDVLYRELLWGADPRTLLRRMRLELKSRVAGTHDWASVVAYAALPSDLSSQLTLVQMRQARACISAALDHADAIISSSKTMLRAFLDWTRSGKVVFEGISARIEKGKERLSAILVEKPADRAERDGLLASTEKRQAELLFKIARIKEPTAGFNPKIRAHLKTACDFYRKAFDADRNSVWGLTQALVLSLVLSKAEKQQAGIWRKRHFEDWLLAHHLARRDMEGSLGKELAWAYGSLIELNLLACVERLGRPAPTAAQAQEAVVEYAKLLNRVGEKGEVYSTRRQIGRYGELFSPAFENSESVIKCAQEVHEILDTGTSYD